MSVLDGDNIWFSAVNSYTSFMVIGHITKGSNTFTEIFRGDKPNHIGIFSGQLYTSNAGDNMPGLISRIGDGLPTTDNQIATVEIPGGFKANGFVFKNSTVAYACYTETDSIIRYDYNTSDSSWRQSYSLPRQNYLSYPVPYSILVKEVGMNIWVYVNYRTRVHLIIDDGTRLDVASDFAFAGAGLQFKGLTFSPEGKPILLLLLLLLLLRNR